MNQFPEEQVQALKAYSMALSYFEDGGHPFFRMDSIELPEGCSPASVNAVLQPREGDGYRSRVFFSQQVQSRYPRNWNTQKRMNEENWYAFSWNFDPSSMTLEQIFLEHLKGFTRP